MKAIIFILLTLFATVEASAQARDYRNMTPEELEAYAAEYGIEHGSRWRFRKPKQSPFTVSVGPNVTL